MIEIGSRARSQPSPPQVVFEALTRPDRDAARPWLDLLGDESAPEVIASDSPRSVTWSSIWSKRPDAVIRFDLAGDSTGTDLRWTLLVDEPVPDASRTGHVRKRLNQASRRRGASVRARATPARSGATPRVQRTVRPSDLDSPSGFRTHSSDSARADPAADRTNRLCRAAAPYSSAANRARARPCGPRGIPGRCSRSGGAGTFESAVRRPGTAWA